MEYFYLTDSGKVRDHNEDSVTILKNDRDEYLLVVADGMGGHRTGEIASSIAITHLGKRFKEISCVGNKEDAINWLKETVGEINILIYKYTETHPESAGMGTTLVLCLKTNNYLLFGNIGDSSGFVYKNKKLHKITVDHTLVNALIASGELNSKEAKDHPRKNILMRALGATSKVEMDIFDIETDVEGVLLCSDGLTNMLTEEQISRVLNETDTLENKVQKLIVKSNNRGGTDNISIACFLKEGEANDN